MSLLSYKCLATGKVNSTVYLRFNSI